MKRVGGLWSEVTGFSNLLEASRRAAAGKRSRPDVARFLLNLEPELVALGHELTTDSYRPGRYREFQILDPKPRMISAAPFRDRVVHHALTQVLEPIFERRFSEHSYACRIGKGTHAALRVARAGASEFRYCLKLDVRKYFASIDHEILEGLLARVIKCKPTLRLAGRIIAGSNEQERVIRYFEGDDLFTPFERRRGLPLGNQTSQFFANVYLDPVDRWVDRTCGRNCIWARYVDDLILFSDDKAGLAETKAGMEAELAKLRLVVHGGKSRIYRCTDGITFLGWRVFPAGMRLERGNAIRAGRRIKRLRDEFQAGRIAWVKVEESVRAWVAHAGSFGWTERLRASVLDRYAFVRSAGPEPAGAARIRG